MRKFHSIAALCGDGLRPELQVLFDRFAVDPRSELFVRDDGMLQAGPDPASETDLTKCYASNERKGLLEMGEHSFVSSGPYELTHNSDPVDEQENDGRDRDGNRRPMKTGEISDHRQRKRDGSEQGTNDVRTNLSDDKGLPMQVLNPEKLAE